MIHRSKEILRDLCAKFTASVLLRFCPALVNGVNDALPQSWLVFLLNHGFFRQARLFVPWRITLAKMADI